MTVLEQLTQLCLEKERRRRARINSALASSGRIIYVDDDSIIMSMRDETLPSHKAAARELGLDSDLIVDGEKPQND